MISWLALLACAGGSGAFQLSTGAVDLGLIDTTVTRDAATTVELQNAGDAPLAVVAAEVVFADGVSVSLDHELPLTLAPGQISELTATVTPTRRGIGDATVRVYAADLDRPSLDLLLHTEALAPKAVIDGESALDYRASCGQGWTGTVSNHGDRDLVLEDLRGDSAAGAVDITGFLAGQVLGPGETAALSFDLPDAWYNDIDVDLVLATNDVFEPESRFDVDTTCVSDWVGLIYWQVSGAVDLMVVADHTRGGGSDDYVAQLRSELGAVLAQVLASGLDVRLGVALDDAGGLAWLDVAGDLAPLQDQVDGWFDAASGSTGGFQPYEVTQAALQANGDFLRADASLMVAMLDPGDQPPDEDPAVYAQRWELPLGRWEHLRIHGLVPAEGCGDPTGGAFVRDGVAWTGGVSGSLCDSSYVPWFDAILDQHLTPERRIPMPEDPFWESLRVRISSVLIPAEYLSYQAPTLMSDQAVAWGPGDYVDIKYVVDQQCLP